MSYATQPQTPFNTPFLFISSQLHWLLPDSSTESFTISFICTLFLAGSGPRHGSVGGVCLQRQVQKGCAGPVPDWVLRVTYPQCVSSLSVAASLPNPPTSAHDCLCVTCCVHQTQACSSVLSHTAFKLWDFFYVHAHVWVPAVRLWHIHGLLLCVCSHRQHSQMPSAYVQGCGR